MTLIIAMAAFILVTTLFILDASKDQNLSSEVSTFLKYDLEALKFLVA